MKETRKRLLALLLALAMLLSMAACGSNQGGQSKSAEPGSAAGQTAAEGQPEIVQPEYEDQLLGLGGVDNARQLGGYTRADGKKVKMNTLIRSGHLANATDEDVKYLSETIGVKKIFDLRVAGEAESQPDREIPGADYQHIDILYAYFDYDESGLVAMAAPVMEYRKSGSTDPQSVYCVLDQSYADLWQHLIDGIALSDNAVKEYQQLFRYMVENDGAPILWHCTHGKDRTGLGAIMIMAALGFDEAIIKEDFLRTNIAYEERIAENLKIAEERGYTEEQKFAIRCADGVTEETFDATIKAINEKYGSLNGYLHDGLGLSDEDLAAIQANYLE